MSCNPRSECANTDSCAAPVLCRAHTACPRASKTSWALCIPRMATPGSCGRRRRRRTTYALDAVPLLELTDDRGHRRGLGLVALPAADLQGKPARSTSSPTMSCGSTRRSWSGRPCAARPRARPRSALWSRRTDTVRHPRGAGVGEARGRDRVTDAAPRGASKRPAHHAQRPVHHTELAQHPQRVPLLARSTSRLALSLARGRVHRRSGHRHHHPKGGHHHRTRRQRRQEARRAGVGPGHARTVVAGGVGVLGQTRCPRQQDADVAGEPGQGRHRRGEDCPHPRFVTVKNGSRSLDETSLARARRVIGLKGCQWPVLGHRWWPSRSPHSSRVVQLVVGRPPVRVRAWSMR
jgi:hypothetical protein